MKNRNKINRKKSFIAILVNNAFKTVHPLMGWIKMQYS